MYHALYRKYRPVDFDSVVGQNSIIMTLKNSIINHSFTHAYMFFGPRGTGKTTVSKIFARSVNCLNPKDGDACGKCDSCKISFSKECVDIIEIDAASNNGVDEIRELRNKISLVPAELKYKVYIIDEVHMLSIGAFNALLKTLEEPPEHVIFILATTDSQKVPETIISRCQCFSFKRISNNYITERLKYVCENEKIQIDDAVIDKISLFSEGGLRDALGMLDKLISYNPGKITVDDFNELNGIISDEDIGLFLDDVLSFNVANILNKISDYNNSGKNLIQIINQIINYSRNIVVDYYLNDEKSDISIDLLLSFISLINEKLNLIRSSGNVKVYFEMLILKFINDNSCEKIDTKENLKVVEKPSSNLESVSKNNLTNKKIKNVGAEIPTEVEVVIDKNPSVKSNDDSTDNSDDIDTNFVDSKKILNIDEIIKVRINNTFATASKDLLRLELDNFKMLNDYTFDQEYGYIVCSILDSKLRAVGSNSLIISFSNDSSVRQNLLLIDKINSVYNSITNSNKSIAIISDEEWDRLVNEYKSNLKNNVKYEIKEEPEVVFEELSKDDIISSSAVELFGDIVEIE